MSFMDANGVAFKLGVAAEASWSVISSLLGYTLCFGLFIIAGAVMMFVFSYVRAVVAYYQAASDASAGQKNGAQPSTLGTNSTVRSS